MDVQPTQSNAHEILHGLDDHLFAIQNEHKRISSIMRGLPNSSTYDDHEEYRDDLRASASDIVSAMQRMEGTSGILPASGDHQCNAMVNGKQCARPFKGIAMYWNE